MKRTAGLLAAFAAMLALAACGDGKHAASRSKVPPSTSGAIESTQSQSTSAGPDTPESSVTATSTDDLAAVLRCVTVKPTKKFYTVSAAYCTLANGHEVELAIFATNMARDQYLSDGAQIAPEAVSVKGDHWAAGGLECTEADLAPLL